LSWLGERVTFGEKAKDREARLRKSGLWKAFTKERKLWRDEYGLTMFEAYTKTAAQNRFLPLRKDVERSVEDNTPKVGHDKPPTTEDCLWVYHNILSNDEPTVADAPSQGAYSLLYRAKQDKDVYKWVLDHISPKSFVAEKKAEGWERDDARRLTRIEKQIAAEAKKLGVKLPKRS